jgi:hypothetical protein
VIRVAEVSRGIIRIEDVEHDLTHLDPFTIGITPKVEAAPTYKVLVSFGHHTFTRAFVEGQDRPAYLYEEGGDARCFCPDRFLASKGLPGLIGTASKGKAYFSQNRNYMLLDQPLGGAPYAVFFNLERARSIKGVDALMFVVSAYEKPGLPPKRHLPAISYATLVSKVVRGEPVRRPKK